MAKDTTTVTVGSVRELTSQELEERDATEGKEAAPAPRDAKEAHAQAVALSKQGELVDIFGTSDIATPVLGQVEDTTETTTTTTSTPRSVVKGEPEVLTKVRLLVDWRDGQGLLHQHGKELELPSNEAIKLLNERRAERSDPPKIEDPGQHLKNNDDASTATSSGGTSYSSSSDDTTTTTSRKKSST